MVRPVLLDIAYEASKGDVISAVILGLYILEGAAFYDLYGQRRSKLGQIWRETRARKI